ncbi:hypothetical protein CC1G_05369 [Coprinopsis cinerea okayama7|uniref:Secreted protein n=1 Tax=Coprinopsis cinerea (strain Okayama-7 / 130 / ATCC MYA-4618 / FGSC 9003) TaxID=240176 RepID=A8NPU9_COPC7|nr:hypothetical protein CC1G_05369 [Coprinopsis cinerea okayama7\|eukprot:XP_001835407.1 hypothetical protein CC1G_05369 [Coprinopsis cinerea okayama7\
MKSYVITAYVTILLAASVICAPVEDSIANTIISARQSKPPSWRAPDSDDTSLNITRREAQVRPPSWRESDSV